MKPILRSLRGERVSPLPIWLMRQAGRYLPEYRALRSRSINFLDFCYSRDLVVEATLQPLERYGFSAAIVFSDILVVLDGLGQRVEFTEGNGPQLSPIRSIEDIACLDEGRVVEYLSEVYGSIGELSERIPAEYGSDVGLIGFAGSAWTLLVYGVGGGAPHDFGGLIKFGLDNRKLFDDLLSLYSRVIVEHLRAQLDSGVEILQLFDSWAGALVSYPDLYDSWVIEPHRYILSSLRESHGDVPVIAFPRGSGNLYERFCLSLRDELLGGAISVDSSVSLDFVVSRLQSIMTVQGNLSPELLLGADFSACESEVLRIIGLLGGGGHIFNLGHGVDKLTDPDMVLRLVECVRANS